MDVEELRAKARAGRSLVPSKGLRSPLKPREFILGFGMQGVGKSTKILDVARACPQDTFWCIDSELSNFERLLITRRDEKIIDAGDLHGLFFRARHLVDELFERFLVGRRRAPMRCGVTTIHLSQCLQPLLHFRPLFYLTGAAPGQHQRQEQQRETTRRPIESDC